MSKSMDLVRKMLSEEKNDKRYTLIKLQIPGGILSGKWWGPKDVRPFLCLHGWMDNCGVFDRLIPLLPPEFSYLTFDLPGHGLSSKYGPGMIYSTYDMIILIERIRREYNWPKVSLIGHSLSGICGFYHCALFSDKIDMLVALDNLQPDVSANTVSFTKQNIARLLVEDERDSTPNPTEPPLYSYEQLLAKISDGSQGSIDPQNAKYLVPRSVKRSAKLPRKYYFSFDGRLRGFDRFARCEEDVKACAEYVCCPVLYCLGKDSFMKARHQKSTEMLIDHFKANGKDNLEIFHGPGNHHFLLTHPESYKDVISDFIRRNRKVPSRL